MTAINNSICIKKRNGFMITAGILEIIFGLIWSIQDGIKSVPMWIFVITGIITLLSVWVEYSEDIVLSDNKIQFYKRTDLLKSVKYSEISSMDFINGTEIKDRKKKFLSISLSGNNKRRKDNNVLISTSNYSAGDVLKIRDIILEKNKVVKMSKEVKNFGKK